MDRRDRHYDLAIAEGERLYGLKSGNRRGRVNMIVAWSQGKQFAPFPVEGSCNRNVFEVW